MSAFFRSPALVWVVPGRLSLWTTYYRKLRGSRLWISRAVSTYWGHRGLTWYRHWYANTHILIVHEYLVLFFFDDKCANTTSKTKHYNCPWTVLDTLCCVLMHTDGQPNEPGIKNAPFDGIYMYLCDLFCLILSFTMNSKSWLPVLNMI